MSVLDKVRKWIDGETAELVLENAARDAQVKPRSNAEEYIVKIARAVEEVMQREMVPLPQGTTIIPTEYIIFMSEEDDKEWQGIKRRGLEQGLYHILAERAKEISGKKKLETQSFAVELRVDGTMEKGIVRVQHGWDDGESNKTSILARPKQQQQPPQQTQQQPPALPTTKPTPPPLSPPNFVQNQPQVQKQNAYGEYQLPPTMAQANFHAVVPQQETQEPEEMTRVKKRAAPELYRLEIWRNGVRQNVIPIFQNEISVGRGSKSKPVDIPLTDDPEISRRHLTLVADGGGNYWVINEGRNPAMINNYEIPTGQRISVMSSVPISVCSYMLRIQPTR